MISNRLSPYVVAACAVLVAGALIAVWAWQDPAAATRLATVASLLVALGTVELALATFSQTRQLRMQASEARHASLRPLLVPDGPLPKDDLWNQSRLQLRIRNVGAGVATNVWGVLLPPDEDRNVLPPQFYLRMPTPVAAPESVTAEFHIGGTIMTCSDTIAGNMLGVPRKHAPPTSLRQIHSTEDPRAARLTLTYAHVFGNKHASIFDTTINGAWVAVALVRDIPMDIDDIDNAKRRSPS